MRSIATLPPQLVFDGSIGASLTQREGEELRWRMTSGEKVTRVSAWVCLECQSRRSVSLSVFQDQRRLLDREGRVT